MGIHGIACKNSSRQREQAGNISIVKAQNGLAMNELGQR